MMERKFTPAAAVQDDADGTLTDDVLTVRAVIASLDDVDSDGDTYAHGAFVQPNRVVISPWNHSSMTAMQPVGQGRITEQGNQAVLIGEIWLDTAAGRDTAALLRHRTTDQEWSYGFEVLDHKFIERNGQRVRQLTRLEPFEASPVWRAAGVGTHTTDLRNADPVIVRAAQEVANHQASQALQAAHLRLIAQSLGK